MDGQTSEKTKDEQTSDERMSDETVTSPAAGDEGTKDEQRGGGNARGKECGKCGQTKSVTAFYKDARSADGYRKNCKACTPPKASKKRYSFPTVSRCARCGSSQTQAYSTHGNVQYRKCLVAVCRNRYPVIGTKV